MQFFRDTGTGELLMFERQKLKLIKETRLCTVTMWSLLLEQIEAGSIAVF